MSFSLIRNQESRKKLGPNPPSLGNQASYTMNFGNQVTFKSS